MPRPAKPLPDYDYLHERLHYDPATGQLMWKYYRPMGGRWNSRYAYTEAGYVRQGKMIVVSIDDSLFLAARIIWKMQTGYDPVNEIDHQDNDPLNQVWNNLREADRNQQGYNQKLSRSNTTGFKGVSPYFGRFRANIRVQGKLKYLGTYDTAEEAYEVYCRYAAIYHGEFFNPG